MDGWRLTDDTELEDDQSYMRTTDGDEDWEITDRLMKGAENRL